MPTFPEVTRRLVRRWNRQARLYNRLTAPMERMLGLVRGRAWGFERIAEGGVVVRAIREGPRARGGGRHREEPAVLPGAGPRRGERPEPGNAGACGPEG